MNVLIFFIGLFFVVLGIAVPPEARVFGLILVIPGITAMAISTLGGTEKYRIQRRIEQRRIHQQSLLKPMGKFEKEQVAKGLVKFGL